jgi:hypothetical protein
MEPELPSKRSRPAMEYEIRIESVLGQGWSAWFDGLQISHEGRVTVISGPVPDQAALLGLLARAHDLGLTLISVHRIDHPTATRVHDPAKGETQRMKR